MDEKKFLKSRMVGKSFTPILSLIFFLCAVLCAALFLWNSISPGSKSPSAQQTDSASDTAYFDYNDDTQTNCRITVRMVEKPFHEEKGFIYSVAVDHNNALYIIEMKKKDFESSLSEIMQYTYASDPSQKTPEDVELTGVKTDFTPELESIASSYWGADAFSLYFGHSYLKVSAGIAAEGSYLLIIGAVIFFMFGVITFPVGLMKSSKLFKTCYDELQECELDSDAAEELEAALGDDNKSAKGLVFTDNFIFCLKQGGIYTYNELLLVYRELKNGTHLLVSRTADGGKFIEKLSRSAVEADEKFRFRLEELMEKCPSLLCANTAENRQEYFRLCYEQTGCVVKR